jgi:type 1 glutamine amidotransferase
MNKKYFLIIILGLVFGACSENNDVTNVNETGVQQYENALLIFSKTAGFRHNSIEAGREAITARAIDQGYIVTATENSAYFTSENLQKYNAVIFLNTTQTVLNDDQKAAFKSYIQNDGGFVGVHSATDTEYEWSWYNQLVGAYFDNHPRVQSATLNISDTGHLSTIGLPQEFERTDEWYNFKSFNEDVNVLMTLDPESFEGSNHPDLHPIAWYHEFDGGRAFYTGGGHTIESYTEEIFMDHLWGGIEYAIGLD